MDQYKLPDLLAPASEPNHPVRLAEFDAALAGKADANHTQAISTVTGLQAALDAKASTADLAAKANASHTHAVADVDNLATQLAGKASTADLAGKANVSHTQAISTVTGLQAALDAKASTTDLAAKADASALANYVPTTRTISTTAPLSGGGNLSANRTLSIADASTSAKGAVQLSSSTSSTSTALAATASAVKATYDLANGKADASHTHTIANVTSLQATIIALEARLAALEDSGGGAMVGAMVGEIRLLPFRQTELPAGWYLCNGSTFLLTSAQGKVLASFTSLFRTDWKITVSSDSISLPNLFSGSSGYFFRPVNNSSRNPGNTQSFAMQNITGSFGMHDTGGLCMHGTSAGSSTLTGAFYSENPTKTFGPNQYGYGINTVGDLYFDASKSGVTTASETRPMNVGMTPAIYLGV